MWLRSVSLKGSPLSVDGTTSVAATVQDQTLTVVVMVEWEAAEGVRRALEFYERARRLLT